MKNELKEALCKEIDDLISKLLYEELMSKLDDIEQRLIRIEHKNCENCRVKYTFYGDCTNQGNHFIRQCAPEYTGTSTLSGGNQREPDLSKATILEGGLTNNKRD